MKLSPIKTFIYYFLQVTWGIIQNVIGLLLFFFLFLIKPTRRIFTFYGAIVTDWKMNSSLGLGMFIFIGSNDDRLLVHEYGHTIQSIILGPLFILLVGIPSFIYSTFFIKYRLKRSKNYYNFYTEKWANILGTNITGMNTIER